MKFSPKKDPHIEILNTFSNYFFGTNLEILFTK